MDHMDMVVTCVSQECGRIREMDNSNRPINGTITILRGPLPSNRNGMENICPLTREDLSEIIDYSIKNSMNQEPSGQDAPPAPNPANQPAAPPPAAAAASAGSKKKRPRFLTMDPVEQALMIAEHERLDALRVKEYDKKNYWLENDEDVAFFNSVLPHVRALNARQKLRLRVNILQVLDEGVPEDDDSSPPGSPNPAQQDVCGFYCGNCGQKFMFNR